MDPKSANTAEVAAPANEPTPDFGGYMSGSVDDNDKGIDLSTLGAEGDAPVEEPVDDAETPKETEPIPGNDPEGNAKWAQLRREAEEAKRLKSEAEQRDSWVEKQFGSSHGLHNWQQYQQAVEAGRQQQAQQQAAAFDQETRATVQKMHADGYDEAMQRTYLNQRELYKTIQQQAQELNSVKTTVQQQQQAYQTEQQQQAALKRANDDFADLQTEYPEFKTLDEWAQTMPSETWGKIVEKFGKGYSLLDAYESTNRQELKKKTVDSAKLKTLNDINSKAHLKTEGDGPGESAPAMELSPETLSMYIDSGLTDKQARAFHKKLYG